MKIISDLATWQVEDHYLINGTTQQCEQTTTLHCIKRTSACHEKECVYANTQVPTYFKRSRYFEVNFVPENYHNNAKSKFV
jgi:hypothetical protein